ncbi:ATP-binding protein [Curtobacterium flaccumfaciens]|uniref:ATP-binding protein n=1 Tax=Curtobacterium flaccumfaciens TaxID=2035 RepID=UPI001BDE7CBC|nr:ATP-binding protein [Curtobacterium flaccumfaciens]MBT1595676.1 ATP-binding protein [Curtobacterium flaccumfaciens pv. flaccumfaciens]
MSRNSATPSIGYELAPGFTSWLESLGAPTPIEQPTRPFLDTLSALERERYDDDRRTAHANIPVIITPQYEQLRDWLQGRLRKNGRFALNKRVCFIIGEPFQGKSRSVERILQQFDLDEIRKYGPDTARGLRRLSVASISMWGVDNPRSKNVAVAIAEFYGIPDADRKTMHFLLRAIQAAAERHETMAIAVDELHYFGRSTKAKEELTNFFKSLQDHLHITLVLVGVGIDALIAQDTSGLGTRSQLSFRSYPPYRFGGFDTSTHDLRKQYLQFVGALSAKLLLAKQPRGQLQHEWALWLLGRSGGRTGLLVEIVVEAADRALSSGREHLLFNDLEHVPLPKDAQRNRDADLEVATTKVEIAEWLRSGRPPRGSAGGSS